MSARLSEADLAALESIDEPLRVTAVADLVANLRAERAKSERVGGVMGERLSDEQIESMDRAAGFCRLASDRNTIRALTAEVRAERAVTARLRVLAAVVVTMKVVYDTQAQYDAMRELRAALVEVSGE